MNQYFYRYAYLAFMLLTQQLAAQTTWTGSFSSNWNQSNNWSNGSPGPFNEPLIPANPTGGVFPNLTVLTYFNFNVQNYGTISVTGNGGVTLFGTFVNHAGSTFQMADTSANFLIANTGYLENFGQFVNNGTFNNEGNFNNNPNAVFENNHIFSHSDGFFQNKGVFNNSGEFFSEAQFQNIGEFNNKNLFNNNDIAANAGVFKVFLGALLRNDLNFQNQSSGNLNVAGSFLNNHIFQNQGQFVAVTSAVVTNGYLIRNATTGNWSNQGDFSNVLCGIFENKGVNINTGVFDNEGVVYADAPIGPIAPANAGGGVVITATNFGSLCHDLTIALPISGPAVVNGLDLANDQLDFCMGWTILINGLPSVNYSGCSSLGQHSVSVTFTDPFGRTTSCPAVVEVIDDLPPTIVCQPTLIVPLSGGQCTASPSLSNPIVLQENCAVASISNSAPATFPIGSTTVNWTVTDQNGNSSICAQEIVVEDQEAPVIICPSDLTIDAAPNICGVPIQIPVIAGNPATATDNCGTAVVSNNAGSILPVGTNTITWKATDSFGNMNFCQQQITILDNQPPIITACPPDLNVQAQAIGCQAVVDWNPAVAVDNCGATTQSFSIPSGSLFSIGSTSVTVVVTDASANTATCQFTVTVEDTQPPVWSNCPSNSTITLLDCGDVAIADWTPPIALDPCLDAVTSNIQLGDLLHLGANNVVYTAADVYGNVSSCIFTITVAAQMAMTCPSDIVVNIPQGETTSMVNWNTPPGTTNCTVCVGTNINGFDFLGEKSGHRYYVYLGGQVSWTEAKTIASQYGGYLVTITTFDENELLRKEFPALFQDAWIGLTDEAVEGQFAWENGEIGSFSNWVNGSIPQHDQFDFGVFKKDGFWVDDNGNAVHSFLMEVPCYTIDVMSSNTSALNSMVFPLGNTTVSYEYTDNCGNACACDFQVKVVQSQQVSPCVATGNSAYGWIETVQTEGFSNTTGDDGGRGDYSNTIFQLPDPGCILKLTPGGPAANTYLYWRIWADLNMDGDFFDDNEVLGSLEGVGEQNFCYDVLANLPTGPVGLRIAMSRWDYAAACGDFIAGESEDYVVEFVDSSLFNPNNCVWDFALFNGVVEDLKIKLNWLGSGNCDVAYFVVERSADGIQFNDLEKVQAQAQSQLPTLYSYADETPFYGKNYYRIRTVMEDSSTVVSTVFETDFMVDFESIFVYPNPATNEVILHVFPFNGLPAFVFIADSKGQIVFQNRYDMLDNEAIKFDLTDYAPGIYSIYLQADNQREQVRRFSVLQH
ncbi:MAG: HYR domain-containing protein [Bacteroidetes bacterium]|nr:HYR domain-containing protein [Bacteroidota bacterium]